MAIRLKVFRADVGVQERAYDVSTPVEAVRQAETEGFHVLSGHQVTGARRRQRFPLVLFSTELVALLTAGLNVIEAFDALAKRERRPAYREVLNTLRRRLAEGQSLSRALEAYPQYFPDLYVASIRASERTGDLLEALQRFLHYREQMDAARKKLIGATLYPALILLVGGLVLLFLLTFVVPRFSQVYAEVGGDLPLGTRWLIAWGEWVGEHGMLAAVGIVALLASLSFWAIQPATRASFARMAWRLPKIGERLRLFQLARFYRTVGMLQLGGIPLVQAFGMAGSLLRQPALASGVARAEQQIREGRPIADALAEAGLTDEVAFRLLKVGERNGELGATLQRIADFFDDELAKWLDWASKLFEPVLMAVVGVVIGIVVVLMYLPIFELAEGLQ